MVESKTSPTKQIQVNDGAFAGLPDCVSFPVLFFAEILKHFKETDFWARNPLFTCFLMINEIIEL